MTKLLLVFLGSGIGGALRYGISVLSQLHLGKNFPYATLTVNLIGSFFMSFFTILLLGKANNQLKYFILIGLLGGFTTFSAFSLETMQLFQKDNFGLGALNIVLNLFLSLGALILGSFFAKQL